MKRKNNSLNRFNSVRSNESDTDRSHPSSDLDPEKAQGKAREILCSISGDYWDDEQFVFESSCEAECFEGVVNAISSQSYNGNGFLEISSSELGGQVYLIVHYNEIKNMFIGRCYRFSHWKRGSWNGASSSESVWYGFDENSRISDLFKKKCDFDILEIGSNSRDSLLFKPISVVEVENYSVEEMTILCTLSNDYGANWWRLQASNQLYLIFGTTSHLRIDAAWVPGSVWTLYNVLPIYLRGELIGFYFSCRSFSSSRSFASGARASCILANANYFSRSSSFMNNNEIENDYHNEWDVLSVAAILSCWKCILSSLLKKILGKNTIIPIEFIENLIEDHIHLYTKIFDVPSSSLSKCFSDIRHLEYLFMRASHNREWIGSILYKAFNIENFLLARREQLNNFFNFPVYPNAFRLIVHRYENIKSNSETIFLCTSSNIFVSSSDSDCCLLSDLVLCSEMDAVQHLRDCQVTIQGSRHDFEELWKESKMPDKNKLFDSKLVWRVNGFTVMKQSTLCGADVLCEMVVVIRLQDCDLMTHLDYSSNNKASIVSPRKHMGSLSAVPEDYLDVRTGLQLELSNKIILPSLVAFVRQKTIMLDSNRKPKLCVVLSDIHYGDTIKFFCSLSYSQNLWLGSKIGIKNCKLSEGASGRHAYLSLNKCHRDSIGFLGFSNYILDHSFPIDLMTNNLIPFPCITFPDCNISWLLTHHLHNRAGWKLTGRISRLFQIKITHWCPYCRSLDDKHSSSTGVRMRVCNHAMEDGLMKYQVKCCIDDNTGAVNIVVEENAAERLVSYIFGAMPEYVEFLSMIEKNCRANGYVILECSGNREKEEAITISRSLGPLHQLLYQMMENISHSNRFEFHGTIIFPLPPKGDARDIILQEVLPSPDHSTRWINIPTVAPPNIQLNVFFVDIVTPENIIQKCYQSISSRKRMRAQEALENSNNEENSNGDGEL